MTDFKKAIKYEQKLRLALCGPTGSGKTYTALVLAKELAQGGKVALIDTEHGSASLYSDEFDFDTLELTSFAPRRYIDAIRAANGYAVLIIDGLSHAWMGTDGVLEQVDKANARSGGNKFTAWRDVTPQHNELVDTILAAPMHVIVTMRSKMEYVMEEKIDGNGRKTIVPRKIGMAPIQREGVEYEFTLVGEMDINHTLVISKSRISALADIVVNKPGREIAATILQWLHGVPAPMPAPTIENAPRPQPPTPVRTAPMPARNGQISEGQRKAIRAALGELFPKDERAQCEWIAKVMPTALSENQTEIHLSPLTQEEAATIIKAASVERMRRRVKA